MLPPSDIILGSWPCGLVGRVKALTCGFTWIESLFGDLFSIEDEVVYINEPARFNFYHCPNDSLVEVNDMCITRGRFNPMISKSFPFDSI